MAQLETRVVNFLKGVSGAGEEMTPEQYSHRIDLFIADLKASFTELGKALVRFEFRLSHADLPGDPPQENSARRSRRGKRCGEIDPYLHKVRAEVVAEMRRRKKTTPLSWTKIVREMRANSAYAARMRGKTDATWIRHAKSGFTG